MQKKHYYISLVVSLFIAIAYILFANNYSFPWCDEIYFSAPAYNFINGNGWNTAGISNPYPPLYSLLLAGWFLLFGLSHTAAVSLEIFLALICYYVLSTIISHRSIFKTPISFYLILLLYWCGFYMPTLFTMGRVDMLVMLLAIILIDAIAPNKGVLEINKQAKLKIAGVSALLPFTAIYPLPFVCFVLFFLFISDKNNRAKYKQIVLYVFGGFMIGIIASILFHYLMDHHLRFIVSVFSMTASGKVSFMDKLIKAYHDIPTLILFLLSISLLYHKKATFINKKLLVFLLLIPALMILAGRYERYYWWMMYIPVIILFAKSIELYSTKVKGMVVCLVALLCVSFQLFFSQYPGRYEADYFETNYTMTNNEYKENQVIANKMVEDNREILESTSNGLFSSALFYYPIANSGNNCWFIYNSIFPESLDQIFTKHDRSKFYWRFYEDYMRFNRFESFPNSGVFFSINNSSFDSCVSFLKREEYFYKEINVTKHEEAKTLFFEGGVSIH